VRDDAADDDAGGQGHIPGAPHGVAEQIQHADRYGASKRDVGIGERGREHFALSAHPAKQNRRSEQHGRRKHRAESESQDERVIDERIGAFALPRAERACNGGGNAAAHPAVRRVLDEHHERKSQRHAGQGICAETAEKQRVECDHAGEGEKVEHIRCRQAQQGGKNRSFQQQLGPGRNRTRRDGRRIREGIRACDDRHWLGSELQMFGGTVSAASVC
jgi:hypothetical protein